MNETKSLLVNEEATKEFIREVVPDLVEDEVLMLLLFARKKYHPAVTDEWMLFRDIVRSSDEEVLMRKIRRNAFFSDDYTDLKTGAPMPMEAFVFYIDLFPKSMYKAHIKYMKECADIIYRIMKGGNDLSETKKFKTKFYSNIQKSNSYKPYIILDVDEKSEDLLEKLLDIVNREYVWISETRGGYHIILEKTKDLSKILYTKIMKENNTNPQSPFKEVEIKGNMGMTAIPGTLQGGHLVKRLKI